MLESFFRNTVFKNFLRIDLNAVEQATAEESLTTKYATGTKESLIYGLLMIPTLLFVDTTVLSSVLIPITMVSGTAWFAVSLINIKKKFEPFGNELTVDLYRSFMTSLIFLSLMTLVSLNKPVFDPVSAWGAQYPLINLLSGIIGTLLVIKMIYDVFSGATKYDMNDSMLTGQSEAAEKYFKKSLSLLNSCASHLKARDSADTTGYFVGLAFFEVFNYIAVARGNSQDIDELIIMASDLKSNPPKTKKEITFQSVQFIEKFLHFVTNTSDTRTNKSYKNIQLELSSIKANQSESQQVLNLRLATILEEMEDMLAGQGDMLFKKRIEIEKRYLVKDMPSLDKYEHSDIHQGYLRSSKGSETRVRKSGNKFSKTTKKTHSSGYREEIEENMTKEEFEKIWSETEGKRVEKTRYRIPHKNLTIELDVFSGKNKGLVIAEIEFNSIEDANKFAPPAWFGKEITGESQYKNVNLAS